MCSREKINPLNSDVLAELLQGLQNKNLLVPPKIKKAIT